MDGRICWVGTSNWEKSYFTAARNVGLIAWSRELTAALDRDFRTLWHSPYAYAVDPGKDYAPPRIGE